MLNRNTKVRSLAEELTEIGLDADKTIGQITRTTKLVESRMGGNSGGGAPTYLRRVKPTEPGGAPKDELQESADDEGGVELSEALKIIKVKRLSSSQKAKGRRLRRKTRSKRKAAGKMYRKRSKRRIKRVAAMKAKRFGTSGLKKLHKGRRKVMMQGDSPLSNLREELNSVEEGVRSDSSNAFEDAALNASWLAMYLGEMFEAAGDLQSADTMYDASDASADLAEQLSGDLTEEDLSEEQSQMLERVLATLVKALRMYEAMGSPSLSEAFDLAEEEDDEGDDEEYDDEDDGDKANKNK